MFEKILTTILVLLPLLAQACGLSVSSGVNFGTYDPFVSSPNTSVGEVSVTCPELSPPPFTVSLDQGSSGSYAVRTLVSGPYTINYNLYLNPSYTTVWGDGTSGTGNISEAGTNCAESCEYTVYARIPGRQLSTHVGSYSDSIMVTLSY